jgi:hypothetical protein
MRAPRPAPLAGLTTTYQASRSITVAIMGHNASACPAQ